MVLSEVIAGIIAAVGIADFYVDIQNNKLLLKARGKNGKILEIGALPIDALTAAKPFKYFEVFMDRISTAVTSKPVKAQVIFRNPQTKKVRLTSLTIIPDANFKTNGFAEARVNGSRVASIDAGDLTDTDAFTLPLPDGGLEMDLTTSTEGGGRGTIEIFFWTSTGTVAAAVGSSLGDY